MIEIKERSRDFNKTEEYLMTLSSGIISVKELEDGAHIPVNGFLIFEDTKEDGSITQILSVITPDKKVYSAQSATFKRSFLDMVAVIGNTDFTIIKTSGKTKKGRDFINCVLDVNSI